MISDDLSLHVPFMLKCFFINKILIIITPLHTHLARTHQLHTAECQFEDLKNIHTAATHCHLMKYIQISGLYCHAQLPKYQHLPENVLIGVIW